MRLPLMAVVAGLATTHAVANPVVLELFTSQSCSSCPPADALLAEYAASGQDVLPLDFHVDYWNYLSWVDRFSSPAATQRQRDYAALLGSEVYTPQMVVQGRFQAVGSDRAAISALVARAREDAAGGPAMALTAQSGGLTIVLGTAPGQRGAENARIMVVGFDRRHITQVGAGENSGRSLTEANVVRAFSVVRDWTGQAVTLHIARPAGERAAVLLQASDGRILAARVL